VIKDAVLKTSAGDVWLESQVEIMGMNYGYESILIVT
jgi:hypothetical protein